MISTIERTGRCYWLMLHRFAECHPQREFVDMGACRHFIDTIIAMLPCERCMKHAREFMRDHWPSAPITGLRLRMLMHNFHNFANENTGKRIMSWEQYEREVQSRGPTTGAHRLQYRTPVANCPSTMRSQLQL